MMLYLSFFVSKICFSVLQAKRAVAELKINLQLRRRNSNEKQGLLTTVVGKKRKCDTVKSKDFGDENPCQISRIR